MSEEVRITGLDAATTMAEGDLFVGVDVSDNTGADDGTEKKYTAKQIAEASKDSTITLTNKTISVDSNTISGISASSFVLSNASGNLDGTVAQKVIPAGAVVGTTDTQTLTNKTITTPTITTPTITTPTITTPILQGYWDAWIGVTDDWAYASATTITVPAGALKVYAKGDKIKLTQTTVKYFYIVGVADTLLTITGGSDYTLADAEITSASYSHGNAVGFPNRFNWTQTLAGGGSMTVSITADAGNYAFFEMTGRKITVTFQKKFTTGGSANTDVTSDLPVNPGGSLTYMGAGRCIDGANTYSGIFAVGGNVLYINFGNANWGIGTDRYVTGTCSYYV